jgi:hypothetical protein
MDLRTIALWQRMILYSILGYVLIIILSYFAPPMNIAVGVLAGGPSEQRRILGVSNGTIAIAFTLLLLAIAIDIFAIVSTFRLALLVYRTSIGILVGIVGAVLALSPLFGPIIPVIIHLKATKVLRAYGVKCNRLGADLRQFRSA